MVYPFQPFSKIELSEIIVSPPPPPRNKTLRVKLVNAIHAVIQCQTLVHQIVDPYLENRLGGGGDKDDNPTLLVGFRRIF